MENSVPCCVCCQGNGATLNGRPIRASAAQDLPRALLATEIGVTRDAATFQVGGGGGGCGCGSFEPRQADTLALFAVV